MTPMTRRTFAGAAAATLCGASGLRAALPAGYRVPAEEEPHARCFMQWPVTRTVYDDAGFRRDTQAVVADIANAIAGFEPVVMLAGRGHHRAARRWLSGAVDLWDVPTDDLWCRDSGPLFAVGPSGGMAVSLIRFNGWGGRQPAPNDARVAERVAARLGLPVHDSGLVGEPGGVETDGQGTLIAHESCWANRNRNPGMDRDEIERRLLAAYGAARMVWAPGVRGRDVTDDHIDGLARLTGPGRVLMNLDGDGDKGDPFHRSALATREALRTAGLAVEAIPAPDERTGNGTYVNYYVANGGVIASRFGDPEADDIAFDALSRHYPGREVVMLDTAPLAELGGGIHCSTQQMPRP